MKVIKNTSDEEEDAVVVFDNGLTLSSTFEPDCCTRNYLDFEQLHIGREFKDMKAGEFIDNIAMKKDGFSVADIDGVPAWVQARSSQNGYYSAGVDLVVRDNEKELMTGKKSGSWGREEQFEGKLSEDY